jgi:hypothetical protein
MKPAHSRDENCSFVVFAIPAKLLSNHDPWLYSWKSPCRTARQIRDTTQMTIGVITAVVRQASTAATGRANPARVFLVAALSAAFALGDLPPASANSPAVELQGRGVQIYTCEQVSGGFAWRLKAPEAALLDAAGTEVGRHFAGPSWQAKDGSTVVGEPLVSSQSPTEGSIPWLVLRAKSHTGSGIFSPVE